MIEFYQMLIIHDEIPLLLDTFRMLQNAFVMGYP